MPLHEDTNGYGNLENGGYGFKVLLFHDKIYCIMRVRSISYNTILILHT